MAEIIGWHQGILVYGTTRWLGKFRSCGRNPRPSPPEEAQKGCRRDEGNVVYFIVSARVIPMPADCIGEGVWVKYAVVGTRFVLSLSGTGRVLTMRRRIGVMMVTLVAVLLMATDAAWACKCLDGLFGRCSARRCCVSAVSCCEAMPVCCCTPAACEPVICGPATAAKAEGEAAPTKAPERVAPAPKPAEEKPVD